ncbi:uncharacterized protein LOC114455398 isoform X1 [Gouania willdenowi]|uniref:Uncharacterized LOC114455398 n=1 Tax=Gouania willdenowi TaxID=441366 RepID=A0A8C5I1J1_GOUWI|nr:uncharacterized protein LOC114455398 isoform X1 [Gouania willdenowi]
MAKAGHRHANCSVVGCSKQHKSLFLLPSVELLRTRWLEFIYNGCVPKGIPKRLYVCAHHFTKECFENMGPYRAGLSQRLRIKRDAAPTHRNSRTNVDIISSVLQGSASSVSRSICVAPPITTSQAGNEITHPCYQPKMISSVLQGSASSVSRNIHIAPPTTTTTSEAGNETTRPCYQPKMISSVLLGSVSSVSKNICVAPPTTTSQAGNETTRPCYQPKLCHVSCQTDPVQIFPCGAKVVVLDQDFSAKVADLQDIIHDHNYHSSDPSTQLNPTFSHGIKSEPRTFSQEIKSEPPTFGLEVTSEPRTFNQEIKSEPPTFGLEVTSKPPTFSQEIKSEPPTFGLEVSLEPPTFSQEIKSEPPTFGLEVTSEPPTFSQEIKSEPPTFGLEVSLELPTFSQEIKSELPIFGLEVTSEPPTFSQEIKSEPPTFGQEIKLEPQTHTISSPIPHSFTAEHTRFTPQDIKIEPSSDAAVYTSHNVLLDMNDTNYAAVDTCLTQLNLTTCKECNSRVNGITKVVEGGNVIYKVEYLCSHPELSWSAHPLLGNVKSEL